MSLTSKLIWIIERNLDRPLSLDEIAQGCAVSKCHATHAFSAGTNMSLMQYVRARRLSLAAHSLAEGSDDIIAIALDAGYGSHEAFTRAFKLHFNVRRIQYANSKTRKVSQ